MKPLYAFFLIFILVSSATFAQTQKKPKPYLFDEFGKVNRSEFNRRYSAFLTELVKDCDLTGYIINYGSAKDVSATERGIRNQTKTRRCSYSGLRIVIVNGGETKEQKVQFWIVPVGADPPELISDEPPKANKIDEFGEVSDRYFNWSLDNFVERLREVKTATGYIVNYGSDEEVSLRIKEITKHFGCRDCLMDLRIVIMNGGTRKTLKTELWIVPQGVEPPTP
jgi:hypothetical protein